MSARDASNHRNNRFSSDRRAIRARRLRRRVLGAAVATCLVAGLGTASSASASGALGAAYASNGIVNMMTGVSPTITSTGLLAPANWLASSIVQPLVSGITSVVPTAGSGIMNGLVAFGLRATASTLSTTTAPASGFPNSCTANGWDHDNCYGPEIPTIGNSQLGLSSGLSQGFATATSTGYVSRAQVLDPELYVLGLDLGNLGILNSESDCDAVSTCTGTHSLTNLSLVGGLVKIQTWSPSGVAMVQLANGTPMALTDVSRSWTSFNSNLAVRASQDTMYVRVGISVQQLLDGLGIGGLLTGLGIDASASTLALTVSIHSGSTVNPDGSVTAYGVQIGLDLSGDINLSLLGGLSTTDISIPTGISDTTNGNLADFDLAYSTAAAGPVPGSSVDWVPAGLR